MIYERRFLRDSIWEIEHVEKNICTLFMHRVPLYNGL